MFHRGTCAIVHVSLPEYIFSATVLFQGVSLLSGQCSCSVVTRWPASCFVTSTNWPSPSPASCWLVTPRPKTNTVSQTRGFLPRKKPVSVLENYTYLLDYSISISHSFLYNRNASSSSICQCFSRAVSACELLQHLNISLCQYSSKLKCKIASALKSAAAMCAVRFHTINVKLIVKTAYDHDANTQSQLCCRVSQSCIYF